jgi:hypothetical protein
VSDPNIDRETFFERIGYTPHSREQWVAHTSPERFKIACCGRRWGKTTFAANELTYQSFNPESVYWIVAPTYGVADREFKIIYGNFMRKLPEIAKDKGFRASYNVKQGDMKITLPWGTIIEAKSSERPNGLVGEGLDGVIFSEAALQSKTIWEQYIQPALSDKRGWCIFPSTPRGYNWYHGLWMLGQEEEFLDYVSWTFPTWTNKARYPAGLSDPELVQIKATATRAFWEQEYGAKFTAFEGQIYEDFDRRIHVVEKEYDPRQTNILTLDFGFNNPFVALDIMIYPDDTVHVWREYQVTGKTTWDHGQFLTNPYNPSGYRENPPGYHIDEIFADPSGLDQIKTLEPMMGPIRAQAVPWENRIETVGRWLKVRPDGKPGLTFHPRCTETIRQMEQLRHETLKEGRNEGQPGQHKYDDHGPDALSYFFGMYFFLRLNAHLSDVYGDRRPKTESESFFKLHQGFIRSGGITA